MLTALCERMIPAGAAAPQFRCPPHSKVLVEGMWMYSCSQCAYKVKQLSHYKYHERTHTGERPFKCDVCPYAATVPSHLKDHMRTHTGKKPFACKYCSAAFTESGHLKVHMRTHTGEKPYHCAACAYAATQSSDLNSHMRRMHAAVALPPATYMSETDLDDYDVSDMSVVAAPAPNAAIPSKKRKADEVQ